MAKPRISLYSPEEHRDQVLNIFKSRPDIFPAEEIEQISDELKLVSQKLQYKIVATIDNKVAGYADIKYYPEDKYWYLHWLSVSKNYQKQGVGGLLVDSVVTWLRKKRISQLKVQTCSCEGEAPARSFYFKNGFTPIDTEKDGYGKGHSKITFLKKL